MRAVLIMMVLMAWVWCVAGAIGLTGYLAVTAVRTQQAQRSGLEHTPQVPPPRGAVAALVGYALVMAACGAGLAAVVLHEESSGALGQALAWAALPWWSALAAAGTATVLWRRASAASTASTAATVGPS